MELGKQELLFLLDKKRATATAAAAAAAATFAAKTADCDEHLQVPWNTGEIVFCIYK